MSGPMEPTAVRAKVVRYVVLAAGLLFLLVGVLGAWIAFQEANRASACLAGGCLTPVQGDGMAFWQAQVDTYRGQATVYGIVAILGAVCAVAALALRRRLPPVKGPGP